jgi:opacity protein-like surface antigen
MPSPGNSIAFHASLSCGLAWGGIDHSFVTGNIANTFVETEEDTVLGYQLGGGVDFKFGGRWTAGAESQRD